MPDRITDDTIHNTDKADAEKLSAELSIPGIKAADKEPADYFRHKGVKVKFETIEKVLVNYDHVDQAVVKFSEDNEGNRRLIAYVIPNGIFNQMDITQFLAERVKPYMIPAIWVCLDKFPINENSAIDRNALQEPGAELTFNTEFLAPQNETEIKLAAIIQDLLALKTISTKDNFFRLGGGSLQALRVIAAIRQELDVNLDIKYFFVYPTIEALAGYLRSLSNKDAGDVIVGGFQRDTKWSYHHSSSIVPIKAGSSKTPLYIVCGGGGTVFTFEKFAYMLDDDQPVYGFQQPSDIEELEKFPGTIETIAERYVAEMLVVDPTGPYALSGHCIGGVIALEMARILQGMGKKIKLLAMFDVILPANKPVIRPAVNNLFLIPEKLKKVWRKFTLKVDFETFLLTRHSKDDLVYKFNSFKSLINKVVPFQKEDVELMVFRKFEEKFELAYENYNVHKYSGDILVFYAKDHYRFLDKNRDIRFKKYSLEDSIKNRWVQFGDNVKIFEIEGGHSTMFEPFYSKGFAGLLQKYLKV
ncbi:hypothetical protein BH11BAC3_BH11BAC3_10300 [soil metagenome]